MLFTDIEKLISILPGTDCGKCGFPNCGTYAFALVTGQSSVYKCFMLTKLRIESVSDIFNGKVRSYDADRRLGCMPADHLEANRNFYFHHGIYLGDGKVIHWVKDDSIARVEITNFETYADNCTVSKVNHQSTKYNGNQIIMRAMSRLGESGYNLAFENCEHFCYWCIEGISKSYQIENRLKNLAIFEFFDLTWKPIGFFSGICFIFLDAKIARKDRIRIEKENAIIVKILKEFEISMNKQIFDYLCDHFQTFSNAFTDMKISIKIGDVDGFIQGANDVTHKLGGRTQFDNLEQFDELILSPKPFKL
jgi:Na+-translocating ferredoxin:NAD+ oxidoreductase RNF subunit RnfB